MTGGPEERSAHMKITWRGHACFTLEQDGYVIAVDPYQAMEGYPPLRETAHAVFCSHEHFDHNGRGAVTLLPERQSPFTVADVPTFHDEVRGAQRGPNTVRIFSAGGVRVCHLGDLGHALSEEQRRLIGPCDVLFVPVGGVYTLDAAAAAETVRMLAPRRAVPMHYAHPPYGLGELATVEDFLSRFAPETVTRLNGNSFSVPGTPEGIVVPAFVPEGE